MKVTGLIRKFARIFAVGAALALAPAASYAGIFISVGFAPPALPIYVQPVCPNEGYLWNPGYWGYGDDGYYWVPGVWVQPPTVGVLWTPGYWGWSGGAFAFNEGYWGPHVGFYGGINYGFGFGGIGFGGGEWRGGHFAYNTAYSNVNTTSIHNTYVNNTTVNNTTINNSHTSFNGGTGGIQARPSAQEQQYSHESHVPPTAAQTSHIQAARAMPANYAKNNGGKPAIAAIQRPGATNTAVAARGAAPISHAASQPTNNRSANAANASRPNTTNQARTQTQAARPETQAARPQTQAARPETQTARPQTQTARPQAQPQARPQQQAKPQAAPRQQAKPAPAAKPASHGGEEHKR